MQLLSATKMEPAGLGFKSRMMLLHFLLINNFLGKNTLAIGKVVEYTGLSSFGWATFINGGR